MKKIITILILILILSLSVSAKGIERRSYRLQGDLNNDVRVDIIDVQIATNLAVGHGRITPYALCVADFNRDRRITIIDALFIEQTRVGIRPLDLVMC